MVKVMLLDDMPYIRYRVKEVLNSEGIELIEASNSLEFFDKLEDNKEEVNLIILEIGLSSEDGFEVLRKIKARELKIPIIILTKINDVTIFLKCIHEGTSDYIIKPFDNEVLKERVNKQIKPNKDLKELGIGKIIHSNLHEYMFRQIVKAKEDNNKVSFMALSLTNDVIEKDGIDDKETYVLLLDLLFNKLKKLFKPPNLFVKYDIPTFIGVLPNCDKIRAAEMSMSMSKLFNVLKNSDSRYSNYSIQCVFATFPDDGEEKQDLLDELTLKLKEFG